jgi:hypothetical protein
MIQGTAEKTTGRRRGRPRPAPVEGLVRRNLLVDARAIERLRELVGAQSDSDAVRKVVDAALLVEQARDLREWLAIRGGPVDVFGRTTERSKLPVQLTDDDDMESAGDDPAG